MEVTFGGLATQRDLERDSGPWVPILLPPSLGRIEPGERPRFRRAGKRAVLAFRSRHALLLEWEGGLWRRRCTYDLPWGWLWLQSYRNDPTPPELVVRPLPD